MTKILIVGTSPYNPNTPARAFESYFNKWNSNNLAQFFSDPNIPIKGHCSTFFQITDKDLLLRRFNKTRIIGKIYDSSEYKDDMIPKVQKTSKLIDYLYKIGKYKLPVFYLLRKRLWLKKFWNNKLFNSWLDTFKPEVVFLSFSDDFFILEIAMYISDKFNIPIISSIGDDYFFYSRRSLSPFYFLYRYLYKKLVTKLLSRKGSAIYIGDKIKEKYNKEFGLNGETVYLSSELNTREFRPINVNNPIISYFGNLRLGRNYSLIEIANALRSINKSYIINIYSSEKDNKYLENITKHPNIRFHGFVQYDEVKNLILKSDVILVVESFYKRDINITRYSLSTKVADAISSGVNIFSYGSIECGAIEYLLKTEASYACINKDKLYENLLEFLFDEKSQQLKYEKQIKSKMLNHNIQVSTKIFENLVNKVIKDTNYD